MWDYLASALSSSTSALVVSGERMLAAEFPDLTQARVVLTAIGSGETTFANIAQRAGGLHSTALTRALTTLRDKRIVTMDQPLSTSHSKVPRYRVTDPYLRFWLAFIGPALAEIERGAHARVLARLQTCWPSWSSRAIEPVLRFGVERMGDSGPAGTTGVVGAYWTRTNNPEIDLVIADTQPAKRLLGVGSIKWHETEPFGQGDLAELIVHHSQLPGADDSTSLIAISRTGVSVSGVTAVSPQDIIDAW